MQTAIKTSLVASYDAAVVDELLAAYEEAKSNYYLGGLQAQCSRGRPVRGGSVPAAAAGDTGKFTPLGKSLTRTDKLIEALEQLPSASHPESVRVHIPRALRVVYVIRSKRDAAHLADGIDPNLQDATLVVSTLDWILAEFVRLHQYVSAIEAQTVVEELVDASRAGLAGLRRLPEAAQPEARRDGPGTRAPLSARRDWSRLRGARAVGEPEIV